jgi:hypothetical protein
MSKPIRLTVEANRLPPHLRQYFKPTESCGKCYVCRMVDVFREVRRLLRDDGTLWLNLGDSYASASKGSGGPSDKQLSNTGSRFDARKFNHGVKEKGCFGHPLASRLCPAR